MPKLHLWRKRELYMQSNPDAVYRYNSFKYKFGPHAEKEKKEGETTKPVASADNLSLDW